MATITFKVVFDLNNDLIKIEDQTDYTSGYSGDIHGVITATQDGTAFNVPGTSGSPDITVLSTDYSLSTPIQSSRKWELAIPGTVDGLWVFDYTVYPSGGTAAAENATQKSFTYDFTAPSVSLSLTASTQASQITSTDSTDYTSGGSYTVNSNTRTHNLVPPQGATDAVTGNLLPSPVDSGSSATIVYTGITTGTWLSDVTSVLDYSIGAGASQYNVLTTVNGFAETNVLSDLGLCDIYCCLKALNLRYEDAKCKNKDLAEEYKDKIEDVTRLVTMYNQALGCGNTSDAEVYLNDIKNISECSTECNCYGSGEAPANLPIASAVSSNSYSLRSSNANISIESSGSGTSGDPVVYSLSLGSEMSGDISYIAGNLSSIESQLESIEELTGHVTTLQENTNPGFDMQMYTIELQESGNPTDGAATLSNNKFKNIITVNKGVLVSDENFNSAYRTVLGVFNNSSNDIDSVIASCDTPSIDVLVDRIDNSSFSNIEFSLVDRDTGLPHTTKSLESILMSKKIQITLKIIAK